MIERVFAWNPEKDALLRATRGIGFEDVVKAFRDGRVLADMANPNPRFPGQGLLIVEIDDYAIVVPYISDGSQFFLKTLFPDRKAKRRFMGHRES